MRGIKWAVWRCCVGHHGPNTRTAAWHASTTATSSVRTFDTWREAYDYAHGRAGGAL
ncbi:hypothetical protein [Cellulomonas sp. WB94]|uniref:hypothetical protein n=1 Tax=Cellulomonas sp. WB94 TaxID=2173174 RepID=UPI0013047F76|nr:hypothetical protein [Cellulomonas sp. WB94]